MGRAPRQQGGGDCVGKRGVSRTSTQYLAIFRLMYLAWLNGVLVAKEVLRRRPPRPQLSDCKRRGGVGRHTQSRAYLFFTSSCTIWRPVNPSDLMRWMSRSSMF